MAKTVRILLIDDHALFRNGLRRIIQDEDGFAVVAEAGSAGEGLQQALAHEPDLVILDLSLPDIHGLDLLPQLRREVPRSRQLVVSMHRRPDHIVAAFEAGANGYVTKDSVPEILIVGIRTVLAGEPYLDPTVSKDVLSRLLRGKREETTVDPATNILTRREKEVIRLIAEGLPVKAIAERLCVSPKTVESHRTSIMRKFGLETTVDIVRCAARLRLIDLDDWTQ